LRNKILILGASSFIGKYILDTLGEDEVIATYNNHSICNGLYFNSLKMSLSQLPNIKSVSHAIILLGDTNPETCVENSTKSYELNVTSIKKILDFCRDNYIKPVFTSSEFVFDGTRGNYAENDKPSPILTYGKQKTEVEKYIINNFSDYLITRLAKTYSSNLNDNTLFSSWIRQIQNKETINCATDQIFSPVYVYDVAEAIINLIKQKRKGIFHISGTKSYNRFDLLRILIEILEDKHIITSQPIIKKCLINDFNLNEKRPVNVSMLPDKLIKETSFKLKSVENVCYKIVNGVGKNYENFI